MPSKHGDLRTRIAGGIAAAAAGYVTRKLITFAWTRVTGKVPPDDPNDPQVAFAEAISWAVVVGVGMEVARLLATRATVRRLGPAPGEPSE